MPKKKKKEAKKGTKKSQEANGAAATRIVERADGQIAGRGTEQDRPPATERRILDAWIGSGVRLKHPVNQNSVFAVGSTTGQLDATDDRGVLLRLKRDVLQFYPWNCVYTISPDEKGDLDQKR